MSWKIRFFLLASVSIPAFTGYPVNTFNDQIIPGVTWGWVWYWLAAGSAILCILGSTHFSNAIAVSALITLPVVFVGGGGILPDASFRVWASGGSDCLQCPLCIPLPDHADRYPPGIEPGGRRSLPRNRTKSSVQPQGDFNARKISVDVPSRVQPCDLFRHPKHYGGNV